MLQFIRTNGRENRIGFIELKLSKEVNGFKRVADFDYIIVSIVESLIQRKSKSWSSQSFRYTISKIQDLQ